MSTSPIVPMASPATASKNSDGTWTVRIQHTVGGNVTEVDFKNLYTAELLAKGYAAMLNGEAVVDAKITQIANDVKPALADAEADLKRLVAAAEGEAKNILDAAKLEAEELKTEAVTAAKEVRQEAEKLLNEARTKAASLLSEAAAAVAPKTTAEAAKEGAKAYQVQDDE